jgi:SAM-dependent methyltransferase
MAHGVSDPAASGLTVPLPWLRCPVSGEPLAVAGGALVTPAGDHAYDVIGGIPVLVSPALTPVEPGAYRRQTTAGPSGVQLARRLARAVMRGGPSLSLNVAADRNYRQVLRLLTQRHGDRPLRVLVVGGATEGTGAAILRSHPLLQLVEVDLAVGPRTLVVCDAHHLPFTDGLFHAVIAQAVLEHVLDPVAVVDEIHRVLEPEGLFYSEIPFMQQVHEGAHDVTRFTLVGHRRLCNAFDEVDSGVSGGPAMAMLWSIRYFLLAFTTSRAVRALISRVISLVLFWVKYIDLFLARRPGGIDAASGTYFLGVRRAGRVTDASILAGYRGAVPAAGVTAR